MKRRPGAASVIAAAFVVSIAASVISLNGQSASPPPPTQGSALRTVAAKPVPSSTDTRRALLDRYCVTCHNDRLKTANLSLQGIDLTKVADRAELWEKVIRKLRAGVMPPPDMARSPLPDYEAPRDWLENEVDY